MTTDSPAHSTPSDAFQALHPDSLRLQRWIGGGVIAGLTFLCLATFGWGVVIAEATFWQWIALVAGIAVFLGSLILGCWVYPKAAHRHASWRINADGLEIRRGVWWRHRIIVPHSRMQHSDIEQGPLQRLFALATLVIHTAGTTDASVELPGLKMETAERLRDELMNGTWWSSETQRATEHEG